MVSVTERETPAMQWIRITESLLRASSMGIHVATTYVCAYMWHVRTCIVYMWQQRMCVRICGMYVHVCIVYIRVCICGMYIRVCVCGMYIHVCV